MGLSPRAAEHHALPVPVRLAVRLLRFGARASDGFGLLSDAYVPVRAATAAMVRGTRPFPHLVVACIRAHSSIPRLPTQETRDEPLSRTTK